MLMLGRKNWLKKKKNKNQGEMGMSKMKKKNKNQRETAMSKINTTKYLKRPYTYVILSEKTGRYYGELSEFPNCNATGKTIEETLSNLDDAAKGWIESELELGHGIPKPLGFEAFSGKFALRLPRGLHEQAAGLAVKETTSLNQYIVTAVAARVGADDLYARIAEKSFQFQQDAAKVNPRPKTASTAITRRRRR